MLRSQIKLLVMTAVIAFNGVPLCYGEEQLLVVTSNSDLGQLSKWQLRQIYLEDGMVYGVKPLSLPIGSKERAVFNTKVIGLTESRLRSYWTQKRFTGRGTPPREFESVGELLEFLSTHQGYIAYLPKVEGAELSDGIKVVYRISY